MIRKISIAVLSIALLLFISTAPAYAQSGGLGGLFNGLFGGGSNSGSGSGTGSGSGSGSGGSGDKCGDTQTHLISCDSDTGTGSIGDLIKITLFVMTILVGIVATGGLAYAGILYASARDDREKVSQALTIIRNVVLGLIFYAFTVAIVNWLIPYSVIK